jgi:hypothetical protein
MQAHRIHVVIPEDHRATIEFPATIPSGPVELIVLVPPQQGETPERTEAPPQSRGRLAALASELARDPRPFRDLSPEERRARLRRLRGAGRGLTSGSEDLAKSKREEVFEAQRS